MEPKINVSFGGLLLIGTEREEEKRKKSGRKKHKSGTKQVQKSAFFCVLTMTHYQ